MIACLGTLALTLPFVLDDLLPRESACNPAEHWNLLHTKIGSLEKQHDIEISLDSVSPSGGVSLLLLGGI